MLAKSRQLPRLAVVHPLVRLIAETKQVPFAIRSLRIVFSWPDMMHSSRLNQLAVSLAFAAKIPIPPQDLLAQINPASVTAAVVKSCFTHHGLATSIVRIKQKAGASNNTQILRIITGSGFQSTGLCECRSVFRIYNPGNTPGSFRLTSSPSLAANACFACILDSSANHPLQLALYHYLHENSTLFTLLLSLIIYVSSPKII